MILRNHHEISRKPERFLTTLHNLNTIIDNPILRHRILYNLAHNKMTPRNLTQLITNLYLRLRSCTIPCNLAQCYNIFYMCTQIYAQPHNNRLPSSRASNSMRLTGVRCNCVHLHTYLLARSRATPRTSMQPCPIQFDNPAQTCPMQACTLHSCTVLYEAIRS